MNEGYRAWEALKSVLSNRGLGINAKKGLYYGVFVLMAFYGTEAWSMGSAERRKVKVFEMKWLRRSVGVSWMDRVRNEEVRRRASIEREFASKMDQRVLRWFGHMERMDEYRMARNGWKKGEVFYSHEPPSGESTTTECGVNYQLLVVIYRSSLMGNSF